LRSPRPYCFAVKAAAMKKAIKTKGTKTKGLKTKGTKTKGLKTKGLNTKGVEDERQKKRFQKELDELWERIVSPGWLNKAENLEWFIKNMRSLVHRLCA